MKSVALVAIELLLLTSHLSVGAVRAQWPPEIVPGARVQAQLAEAQFQNGARRGHLLRGRVASLAPDTLYLAVTDSVGPLAIPRRAIQRLDHSRGVPSRASSALARGLRAGLASALLLVVFNELNQGSDLSAAEAALVGGAVGLGVGGLAGALRPEERWQQVRLGVSVPAPR